MSKMKKGSSPEKYEITELFMAKRWNDYSQRYYGTIRRETDENGDPIVYGKININGGYILASAKDQWELGDKLDSMVVLILDKGLHDDTGRTFIFSGTPYSQN